MATRRATSLGLILAAAALAPLAGCGKRQVASNDPAKVCSSPDTTERIRTALFEKAIAGAPSSNRYALPKLQPKTEVTVTRPLVESFDAATRRTNCTGVLKVSPPGGVMTVGALRVPIRFSSQPLADGSGVAFELNGADEVVASLAGADLSVWAKTNAPPAAPGLVVEVVQPGGKSSAPPETPVQVADAEPAPPPRPAPALKPPPPAPTPAPAPAPVPAKPAPPPVVVAERKPAPPPPAVERKPAPAAPVVAERKPAPPPPRKPAPPPIVVADASPQKPLPPKPRRPVPPPEPPVSERAEPRPQPPPRPADSASASADGPVRVFVHVPAGGGRGEAEFVRGRLADLMLRGAPVGTPAVRTVARTPPRNEVRCLKRADCAAARRVGAYLARYVPGGVTVVDMSGAYEHDAGVRPGSLELWLRSDRGGDDEDAE